MQTFYPVFESGQVLTSSHLNQLTVWLNEQQLMSRSKLFGIGVVCGLQVIKRAVAQIEITSGVAVTSLGHLILQEQNKLYSQYRDFQLPVSEVLEDNNLVDEVVVSKSLLPIEDIAMWELLTDDYQTAPGTPVPQPLNAEFCENKVVLLLVEASVESTKNCDLNNCADKGGKQIFTLRTLLIDESDAVQLWQLETADSSVLQPQDQHWQQRQADLTPLAIQKLSVSANGTESLEQLRALTRSKVADGWAQLSNKLEASYQNYAYLLGERFSIDEFPNGPWFGIDPRLPVQPASIERLLTDIHAYDRLKDAVASYNEFIDAACQLDGLCCANENRFAFHVLLGKPQTAERCQNISPDEPLDIDFNIGAQITSNVLRHPFYPGMQLQGQHKLAMRVSDLFYRSWLLFKRYYLDDLLGADLRITPSTLQGELSNKAIPYYLRFNAMDDLHRNWHPSATRCQQLAKVHGYGLHQSNVHPMSLSLDNKDFYRIEGLLAKPLGQVIAELKVQKQQLGLSFGVEPVFLPVEALKSDAEKAAILALLQENQTLLRLFKCKLSDIDMIFLLVIAILFQLLLAIMYALARLSNTATLSMLGQTVADASDAERAAAGVQSKRTFKHNMLRGDAQVMAYMSNAYSDTIQVIADGDIKSNDVSDLLLKQVRKGNLASVDLLTALEDEGDANGDVGLLYQKVKAVPDGSLYDRVSNELKGSSAQAIEQNYQTVRMLAQTEKLLTRSSVNSVAEFDFEAFDTELSGLNDAYREFEKTAVDDTDESNMVFRSAITSNIGNLSTLGTSALLSNITGEFQTRVKNILDEFIFDGYSRRHPGIEHLCGVPKGGTLVLAYTHKSQLQDYQKKLQTSDVSNIKDIGAVMAATNLPRADFIARTESLMMATGERDLKVADTLARFMKNSNIGTSDKTNDEAIAAAGNRADNLPNLDDIQETLAEQNSMKAFAIEANFQRLELKRVIDDKDPLNDFVVVADFCLPTYCCDSDCSDLDFVPKAPTQPSPTPSKVRVSGTIVSRSREFGGRTEPITHAKLEVFNQEEQVINVKMVRGTFLFSVVPGKYRVLASAPGFNSKEEMVTIKSKMLQGIEIELAAAKGKSGLKG